MIMTQCFIIICTASANETHSTECRNNQDQKNSKTSLCQNHKRFLTCSYCQSTLQAIATPNHKPPKQGNMYLETKIGLIKNDKTIPATIVKNMIDIDIKEKST